MSKKFTTKNFIQKANEIHEDKYDYSLVEYKTSKIKIKIICNEHGVFEQSPSNHMKGQNCPLCANTIRNRNNKLTNKKFINKANEIHDNKYDYSLVKYKNNFTNVKIKCFEHGIFEQLPTNHLKGYNCPLCANKLREKNKSLNTKKFIQISKEIHGDEFDYSLVEYTKMLNNVKIICPIHGIFLQKPIHHIHKSRGCPICKESKGEKKIRNYLNKNKINFKIQKRFVGCKNLRMLPFDFYLPQKNILIEYDGEQHFKEISLFGGEVTFKKTQKNDNIKNYFAKEKNISLIRIPYYDYNNIEKILNKII